MGRQTRILIGRRQVGLTFALLAACTLLSGRPGPAQDVDAGPALARAVHEGRLRLSIVTGRLMATTNRPGNYSVNSGSTNLKEQLTVRNTGDDWTLTYDLSSSQELFSVHVAGGDRIRIRRVPKNGSNRKAVQFVQEDFKPPTLVLGSDQEQRTYRAANLWLLLIAKKDLCRKHLVPLLERLRANWDLSAIVDNVEKELFRMAAAGELPSRQRWAQLVDQLADDRFHRREAADRELRASGRSVVTYLEQLDTSRLDAEQQFRIRRIIAAFSSSIDDDTIRQTASWLAGDPAVWLALLEREQESSRRMAAKQLECLLERPISFDPAADRETRKAQIEELRATIESP